MSGDLVESLKRAGEQVLGAKPLTGNGHVRLSALLKVAASEIEALCAARDDTAELAEALKDVTAALMAADPKAHFKADVERAEAALAKWKAAL